MKTHMPKRLAPVNNTSLLGVTNSLAFQLKYTWIIQLDNGVTALEHRRMKERWRVLARYRENAGYRETPALDIPLTKRHTFLLNASFNTMASPSLEVGNSH